MATDGHGWPIKAGAMDASKYVAAHGDAKYGIDRDQAIRLQIANDLRDMADEIERGDRQIFEMHTAELVKNGEWPRSFLTVVSTLSRTRGSK